MATDDCWEVGSGACPCGKGIITVEKCVPDHPWAKESQASYTPALVCEDCKKQYAFFRHDILTGKSRLVRRDELNKHKAAQQKWHEKLGEIEASPNFKNLSSRLDRYLALIKSAAGRYRVLSGARFSGISSLPRFRKSGYKLSSLDVSRAIALLNANFADLTKLAREAEELASQMHQEVRAIKTGITGLEQ